MTQVYVFCQNTVIVYLRFVHFIMCTLYIREKLKQNNEFQLMICMLKYLECIDVSNLL